ncbi:MAG: endonuclease/exonuclease/phosphatase family protein [Elainellaceae cyanobacterium]
MDLTLMTFNLRYDKPDPGDRAWSSRKKSIAAVIQHYSPDIIGTQEGKAHQLLDLHRLLPDYQSTGGDRYGNGMGEHCAIFYNSQQLTCLESTDIWLSDTPDVSGSMSAEWGNPLPRMATYATFIPKHLHDDTIVLCNTHLDYESATARERGAQLICDRLIQPSENVAVFVTGDFNCPPDSPPRQWLAQFSWNTMQMADALAGQPLDSQMTYHDFSGRADAAIDSIYYAGQLHLTHVEVNSHQWNGVYPSDHFPVYAAFQTPTNPKSLAEPSEAIPSEP